MSDEQQRIEVGVAGHYGGPDLMAVIERAAAGPDGTLDPARLERMDEFHIGGAEATDRLLAGLELAPGARLLDLGSGVGGPARRAARVAQATVTGVDLTPRFVELATDQSRRVAAGPATTFRTGSILDLPFADGSFDAAMMLHVGMNIADKPRLMAEAARVLRPGGRFAIYDVMRAADGPAPLAYPMPWSTTPDVSFVATAADYRAAAEAAGLEVLRETPRLDEARAFFAAMRAGAEAARAAGQPPPPGIGLVMGDDAATKLANLAGAVMAGVLVPTELHLRKPDTPRRGSA